MLSGDVMEQHSRLNNFDQVRLFGAILVIYGHASPLTGASGLGDGRVVA
jgi:peptidoglycan/LPS O-acetylase OafA/YrhL